MHTVRMNITLPEDVARHLKKIKNKSAFIAESIKEKIEHLEETHMLQQLEAAYQEETLLYMEDAKLLDGAVADGLTEDEDEAWRNIYRGF